MKVTYIELSADDNASEAFTLKLDSTKPSARVWTHRVWASLTDDISERDISEADVHRRILDLLARVSP